MKIRSNWREILTRKVEGLNWAELSRGSKLNPTYLRDILKKGQTPQLKSAEKLSDGLGIALTDWFLENEARGPVKHAREQRPADETGDSLLPVMGMAEGGPDGWNLWNGEIIQYIQKPDNLKGVRGAYAVFITGTSMHPRYHEGELVHINPAKPVTPGCYVLVQKKPKADGDAPLAVVKQLVRRSASKITLAQLSPAKTFDVRADDIVSIHRVVGASEA